MIARILLEKRLEQLLPFTLLGLIFAIPTSVTFRCVFLVASVGLILISPFYQPLLTHLRKNPLAWASVALFLVACVGCLWSKASSVDQLISVEKYIKFLFFPILIAGFYHQSIRYKGLNTYLAAMVLVMVLSILKWFGVLQWGQSQDFGQVFHNHIITGLMMSFAAYIAMCLSWHARGLSKWVYLTLVVLFTLQIFFIGTGRTAYVIYVVLMSLFLLQAFPLKRALIGLFFGFTAVIIVFFGSPVMQHGMVSIVHDLQSYQDNHKDTSVGYRLQFHDFSKALFLRHALWGNGTAGFTYAFLDEKPVSSWNRRLAEPHSQYWLLLSEFGLLGAVVLGLFIYLLIRAIMRLGEMRMIATGLLCTFLIGNLSDSLFFYSNTGVFFLTMMSLCLGESGCEWGRKKRADNC